MTEEIKKHEIKGEALGRELRKYARDLASLIGKIPDPLALLQAQNIAMVIGYTMMDLASSDPVFFFVVYPIIEKELAEVKAAENLMRLRLRLPLVRNQMRDLRN